MHELAILYYDFQFTPSHLSSNQPLVPPHPSLWFITHQNSRNRRITSQDGGPYY